MSTYQPLVDNNKPPSTLGITPTASSFSCIANLANTILGSGLLGLPGAFAGAGSLTGTILLLVASLGSANGLRLLSHCARKVGYEEPTSFYSVANAAHPGSTKIIDFAVAIKCFGVATSYLIIVADTMVDSMEFFYGEESKWGERWIWVVIGTACVTSLSFFKTLDALKFTSAIAIVFVLTLTVVIILYSANIGGMDPCEDTVEPDTCNSGMSMTKSFGDTLGKMSTFIFAFTCHQNIFSVCNEIKDRTQGAVDWVIGSSISLGLVLYLVVAWAGYSTFGDNVDSDILNNYPKNGLVTTMRIFVALLVIFSYPLQLDPSRRCITTLINKLRDRGIEAGDDDEGVGTIDKESFNGVNSENSYDLESNGGRKKGTIDDVIYLGITLTFLGCSFVLALSLDDLGVMLALVGATGSTAVSYILPGVIYLKVFEEEGWGATRVAAAMQVAAGCGIMPVALYYALGGSKE